MKVFIMPQKPGDLVLLTDEDLFAPHTVRAALVLQPRHTTIIPRCATPRLLSVADVGLADVTSQ